jgi:hypothetical protein
MAIDLTFGAEYEYVSDGAPYSRAAVLGIDKFVVAYRDMGDSGHGTAKVGTVSGSNIVFGSETEFMSVGNGGTDWIAIVPFSSSGFVLAYRNGPADNHGRARIGMVSGTTITFGDEAEFQGELGGSVLDVCLTMLSDTKFVVGYSDSGDSTHGMVKIGTISGATITFGEKIKFLTAHADYISIDSISESGFIVAYEDGGTAPKRGVTKFGSVSGIDVTFGAESVFNDTSDTIWISVKSLDSSKFVVAYNDDSDSGHGTSKVGTVSGTDISFGVESEFLSTGDANFIYVDPIDSSEFIVSYSDDFDSGHGTTKKGTVDGTTITFGDETEFSSSGSVGTVSTSLLSQSSFVVVYTDLADLGHGKARIGEISGIISSSLSVDFFIAGSMLVTQSGNLFVQGVITAPLSSGDLGRPLDWLLMTSDYYPQIIGTFGTPASSVTIRIWDITDGQNVLVSVPNSGCYSIGNTGRWGWSTSGIPKTQGNATHYFYMMTSDMTETFDGQFLMGVSDGSKWIHPNNQGDYLV